VQTVPDEGLTSHANKRIANPANAHWPLVCF
jgi:hypothetical protein